ncbi:Uma2 family endonuclease [Allostreptomyces psammosilenae]|uniref:Uma2 family endonuclease n=1 Tax=Allostreptomyces psammosilenae TaxID=1892865 RepID=A0A852ZY69_9ACTN|nr:Uma2 family endonuclease [Allostreptomyces psammosilenae]NYI07119.1 Uma2 family endonuclease [Allostreptomyces psammosilenae]
MSAMALEQVRSHVLAAHAAMDVPEGFRAEVIGGKIVLAPTAAMGHARIVKWLERELPAVGGCGSYQAVTIDLPSTGERYIPDLAVLRDDGLPDDEWLIPAPSVELVVEVVSPGNAETDRVRKVRGYARSGIPLYLLVDPLERRLTLFSEPSDGHYTVNLGVDLGKEITLPEPFSHTLDTSGCPGT